MLLTLVVCGDKLKEIANAIVPTLLLQICNQFCKHQTRLARGSGVMRGSSELPFWIIRKFKGEPISQVSGRSTAMHNATPSAMPNTLVSAPSLRDDARTGKLRVTHSKVKNFEPYK